MPDVLPGTSGTPQPQYVPTETVEVGVRVSVQKQMAGETSYHKAEVLAMKPDPSQPGATLYYVHYFDYNKRLDEWVKETRLDMATLEQPVKPVKKKLTGAAAAAAAGAAVGKAAGKAAGSASPGPSKRSGSSTPAPKRSGSSAASRSKLGVSQTAVEPIQIDADGPGAAASMTATPSPRSSRKSRKSTGRTPPDELSDTAASPRSSPTPSASGLTSPTPLRGRVRSQSQELDAAEAAVEGDGTGQASPAPVQLSYHEEMRALQRGGSMTQRPEELARVKNVTMIEIGQYRVHTWYFSPYPQTLLAHDLLYLCETCLEPLEDLVALRRHRAKCTVFAPPGNEIYRRDNLHLFEVDGHKQKAWCRNLCLLSKLFLDHKTLYYDVDPFLFYVLCMSDAHGFHIVGYFSKEKDSIDNYNVACILTLPQHQRKGYGKMLIALSYELSKVQGVAGSPEKPLSDLGLLSYRSYWAETLMRILLDRKADISIQELSNLTCITPDDILHTLQALDLLKYYKGNHVIVLTNKAIGEFMKNCKKPSIFVDPKCLHWTPPVFTANQLKYL